MSESAGSISFIAEQKLLVNRTVSTSRETVFSLLEVISLAWRYTGGREVHKPGLSVASFLRGRDGRVCYGFAASLGLCEWADSPGSPASWLGWHSCGRFGESEKLQQVTAAFAEISDYPCCP